MPRGGAQVHEVDLDEILRLERSRPRTIGEGAGFGAAVGAVIGMAARGTTWEEVSLREVR